MHSQTELRDRLAALAEPVKPVEGYVDKVMRRSRRLRRRRRVTAGAAAAVCVAVLVSMFRVVGFGSAPQLAAPPPDGPFLGWSAVGDVDAGLVQEATDVWDAAGTGGPHTAVRAFVAMRNDQQLHSIAVLQGYDKQGAARLAFFTSDVSAAKALRLRADRPAPDPVTTQVISLVSPRLTGPVGAVSTDDFGTYAIAVAMPGVTTVRVSNTVIDDEMIGDPDAPTSRLVVQGFPLIATAQSTTISGFVKPNRPLAKMTKVFEVLGDGGADGDARGVPGKVVAATGKQIVVAVQQIQAVRRGQLAVVTEGLVGRVTTVDVPRGEATIDLVTSTGFAGPAYTNISDVPGSVRGTGTSLVMERMPTGDKVYTVHVGNRVVMPDPCQPNDQVGAVTVGRASSDKALEASSVELTPTVDLTHVREVSIMTSSTGGDC
ncbi:rod shape-determining protein MreC [Dactylosporangium sp. NPDC005555]|uniref:rod shape-determining protein MreC n=1 Tax=Dactylosporangium sp. NPDC005555 TaxID=3154889 RepID=UPI0033B2392B